MTVDDRDVSIGRMLSRAFGTIKSNPLVTLSISLLFGALPIAALSLLTEGAGASDDIGPAFAAGVVGLSFLVLIASLAIGAITQGVLTRATVAHAEGRKAAFGESIRAGLSVLLPLMALAVLIALASMIGLVFLIVPGVIIYCMWAVAVPALIEERAGIGAALGRSRDLTRGYRWRVFGTLVILVVISWLLSGAAAALGIMAAVSDPGTSGSLPVGLLAWQVATGLISSVLWGTVQASMYVELRNAKDGPDNARLQEVFA